MAVIYLKKETEAQIACRAVADNIEELSDLILIARFKDGSTDHIWFGHDSSFRCLGMANYMASRIADYIAKENGL